MNIKQIFQDFWLPIITLLFGIILVLFARTFVDGWAALGYIIMALIVFAVSFLGLIFSILKKVFKWNIVWWAYILIIFIFFVIVIGGFRVVNDIPEDLNFFQYIWEEVIQIFEPQEEMITFSQDCGEVNGDYYNILADNFYFYDGGWVTDGVRLENYCRCENGKTIVYTWSDMDSIGTDNMIIPQSTIEDIPIPRSEAENIVSICV